VSFKARLQRGNPVQVPKLIRVWFKLETGHGDKSLNQKYDTYTSII
jgi:hypothetical protein